jgi:hypothetical protein
MQDRTPRLSALSRPLLALSAILLTAVFVRAAPGGDWGLPHRENSARTATLTATVVRGTTPVSHAAVRDTATGASTVTDSQGRFTLAGVPVGIATIQIDRADIHSFVTLKASDHSRGRGVVPVTSAPTASIDHPVAGRGHFDAELEGAVTAVDTVGGTLTVQDDTLGSVDVQTTDTTNIRHGNTPLTLDDIAVGMTVHVKASSDGNGGFIAEQIMVQNEGSGGVGAAGDSSSDDVEVQGTVTAIDCAGGTMTVNTSTGDVVVHFDSSTTFKQKGQAATCDDIQVDDTVEADGTMQGDGSLLAAKVSIEAPEGSCEDEIQGTIGTIDSGSSSFLVATDSGDVTVTTDGSTTFEKDHTAISFGDLQSGDQVEVEGTLQMDGSVLACKVSVESD